MTALVRVVLGDIFNRSREIPWAVLKSLDPPGKQVGTWALDNLVEDTATKDMFLACNTFGSARMLLAEDSRDIKECFSAGLVELDHQFFPAFEFCDPHGGEYFSWNFRDFVQIDQAGFDPFAKVTSHNQLDPRGLYKI